MLAATQSIDSQLQRWRSAQALEDQQFAQKRAVFRSLAERNAAIVHVVLFLKKSPFDSFLL